MHRGFKPGPTRRQPANHFSSNYTFGTGTLFSVPHPDEETVRHAGCEARQGIGAASSEPDYPDTGLASGSHSRHQAVAVGARGGSAVPYHAGRKRLYSTPRTASLVMWGGDYLIRGAWIAFDST